MSQKISRRAFVVLGGGILVCPKLSLGDAGTPAVLDHILLGCNDLDRGIAFVEEHTGVRAAFGGVHPGRGTRNALLSLGKRHYLEIIAPDPQQAGAPDTRNLQELVEPRLVGWAANPGDINQFAVHLHSAGIDFEGPTPGSRKRPDGRILQWNTVALENDRQGVLPFFIEWSAGTIHPSIDAPSGCKIEGFTISSPNQVDVQGLCSVLKLDVDVEHAEKSQLSARISGLNGHMVRLHS
jgi:Glyoxalase-like domain